MTKINKLSIHGFKSFAHKTEVDFGDRYNCILGPNGSGKSNIGDALCFVLGRLSAKSMRAEKAANLIFNGGKKHQAAKQGVVEITFDNQDKLFPSEDKEIIVSRTITKSGSSIYRINGKKYTRTEVLDMLASAQINPEGYNIILQGDINRFVDMHPIDRRKIIEQISDISHYEEKKRKALLELNKVEEKLNNAEIILKERKAYLRELKKDRDQALKFKELKDKVDSNRATHIHLRMESKLKEKEVYDKKIGELEARTAKSEEKVTKFHEDIKSWKEEINAINKEIEQKGEKGQVKLHNEIEELRTRVIGDRARISTLKDEINKIKVRKDQFNQEIKDLHGKNQGNENQIKELQRNIAKKKAELASLEKSIADFRKKNKLGSGGELESDLAGKDKVIDERQEEVQKIRLEQQELLREKDRIEYQVENIDQQIKKVAEIKKENENQLKELQQKKHDFKNATLRLNQCLDQDSSYASQLANARRKLVELQEKEAKLNAQTQSIQANLSQNRAVSSILGNNKFSGVYGTVAQLGQVNKQFSQALEASAGGRTNYLVVKDDQTAAECIKFLKSNKLGSASFIPLNKVKTHEISEEDKKLLKLPGVEDFALNLISYKPQYKKAFSYVFGNTIVVESIDTARKVGIGRIKMATLDGNIAEGSGVMKGGFRAIGKAAAFQERDSLEHLEKLEREVSEHQGVISNIELKRESNERDIRSLRKLKGELEGEIITLEKTLHLEGSDLDANNNLKKELRDRLKEVDSELNEIQKKVSVMNRDLAQLKSDKQILRSKLTELSNPRLLAQLSTFEDSRQRCREDILTSEGDLKNLTTQMDQLIGPEIIKIQEIIKQHNKEEEKFTLEIKKLSEQSKKLDLDLQEKEKVSKEFYAKYNKLFQKREGFSNQVNTAENEIEKIRENNRVFEREINLVSLKNAEIKAKLSVLVEEFEKYKDVELLKDKTEQELFNEISKFEAMLAQMSAVNMKALDIYETVEKEFQNLVEKKDSLHTEKEDVLLLMNEIEVMKKEHFMKTFDHANDHFKRIFAQLFKKGDAHLQLGNPDDPFEEGLSIKVKITGKRYMDLKSLSGGEKTLTALAFIFAIQEYQPAKFYILDEIDAALDKHNSEMLSKLIRSYSDKAQYLIISHNDAVISEADDLFGISMNEGISKVTSLKI
ncbi:MAG: chromosome segregation protein SMC [archaeon]